MAHELTEKQKRFCDEYLIDFNATRAYKTVYYTCKKDDTARANSSRLLTKANIQEYIQNKVQELQNNNKITKQKIIDELAKIAFADIRNFYNDNGALKNIKDLDDDAAGAILSVETFEEHSGYGADKEKIGDTKKIKLSDKKGALELLGKHLGIFKDKVTIEQDKPFEVNINVRKSE